MNVEQKDDSDFGKHSPPEQTGFTDSENFDPEEFSKEKFLISFGIGILSAAIGLWFIWSANSAPEGISQTIGHTAERSVTHVLPETTNERYEFILGNLFVFGGVICVMYCLKLVVQYIAGRLRNE